MLLSILTLYLLGAVGYGILIIRTGDLDKSFWNWKRVIMFTLTMVIWFPILLQVLYDMIREKIIRQYFKWS